jgi:hypothetical protein
MRDYRAQDMAFEIVDMSLDERSKYRRLLADNHSASTPVAKGKSQSEAVETPVPSS